MSTEQKNKEVVVRFMNEALTGRNLNIADEVLAPNYINLMTGNDLDGFKLMLSGLSNALSGVRIEVENLLAEGDSVVARWQMVATHSGSLMGETPSGKKVTFRGLTYYRLVDGKIVEDDPISSPDILQALGIQQPA